MEADLYEILHDSLDPSKQLLRAVSFNLLDNLQQLINSGIDVNTKVQEQGGNRALHIAAQKGNHHCVERLLLAGANPDQDNDFGFIPLAIGLRFNQSECVRLLLCTGSVLSDTSRIWPAQGRLEHGGYLWQNYNTDMLKLLLVATPDTTLFHTQMALLYESHVRRSPNSVLPVVYLATGNPLTVEQTNQLLGNTQGELHALVQSYTRVQSLQHYARLAIRKLLRPNVLFAAKLLPLPVKLQDYVLLKDITN